MVVVVSFFPTRFVYVLFVAVAVAVTVAVTVTMAVTVAMLIALRCIQSFTALNSF